VTYTNAFRSTNAYSRRSLTVDDDIEKIIREGEERTAELNKKYEGMNLDALTNFQPELGTREWEGQTYTGFKVGSDANCLAVGAVVDLFSYDSREDRAGSTSESDKPRKSVMLSINTFPTP